MGIFSFMLKTKTAENININAIAQKQNTVKMITENDFIQSVNRKYIYFDVVTVTDTQWKIASVSIRILLAHHLF